MGEGGLCGGAGIFDFVFDCVRMVSVIDVEKLNENAYAGTIHKRNYCIHSY